MPKHTHENFREMKRINVMSFSAAQHFTSSDEDESEDFVPKKRQLVIADEACDPSSDEDFAPKRRQPKQTSSDENESEDFVPTRSQAATAVEPSTNDDPHAVSSDDDFVPVRVLPPSNADPMYLYEYLEVPDYEENDNIVVEEIYETTVVKQELIGARFPSPAEVDSESQFQSTSGFTQAMVTKARQTTAGTSSSSSSTPLSAGEIAQKGRGRGSKIAMTNVMSRACRKAIDTDMNRKFLDHGECACFLLQILLNYR
jgi:hypothetical protein